ncbi:hypothetical protein [Bacillus bombysepticus]|uniref:hypothetical protein n=1 Tax=Bacillus bombysepticus TaxID=658666 RepID=UPI003019C823
MIVLNYIRSGIAISDFEIDSFLKNWTVLARNKETHYAEFSTKDVLIRYGQWVEEKKIPADTIIFKINHNTVDFPLASSFKKAISSLEL